MRTAFIKTLTQLAREDERVALLMAEVGFSVVEDFEREFPGRFYNTGIAEQDLINISAGMALKGMRPVAYSMACFLASRAFEQIKVSLCYQNLPVVVVGVGTGLVYGSMGATHHATEDICIMKALPNMTVICPADPVETAAALRAAFSLDGPCYIGIGKANDPVLHQNAPDFKIGRAIKVSEGTDIAIITTGSILESALYAANLLRQKGVSVKLYSMHTVKPIDKEAVVDAFRCPCVFTLEEHNKAAGLGTSVAAAALEAGVFAKTFRMLGVPDCFAPTVGGRQYQQKTFGIDGESVAATIGAALGL